MICRSCTLIDAACLANNNISINEAKTKYIDMEITISLMWNTDTTVPKVIREFEAVKRNTDQKIEELPSKTLHV